MEPIMSLFIKLQIDPAVCLGIEKCGKCIQVCPVNIFEAHGNYPEAVEDNEDECTLCNLCLDACDPHAITIRKLYEES
jgi:NAD-dependent dihydropyrimidine dehydrogenase PreA subunit